MHSYAAACFLHVRKKPLSRPTTTTTFNQKKKKIIVNIERREEIFSVLSATGTGIVTLNRR